MGRHSRTVVKMAGSTSGILDLKKQFVFYAPYHNHPVNVLIHLGCIWNLMWSGMCLLHFTPSLAPAPSLLAKLPLLGGTPINLQLLVTTIYVVTYVLMDPMAGTLAAAMVLFLHKWTFELVTANAPVQGYPLLHAVIVFHLVMWVAQFIGHGVFEGRAPALLDSWQQAFITAPLFVVLEVLFFLGYRAEFYQDCMAEVKLEINKFRA